jgi:hypothetical protein
MQVVFMVGGLGSNRYLTKYLKSRIDEFGNFETVVKQPSAGYASPTSTPVTCNVDTARS